MATSGSVNYSLSARQIAAAALELIGVVSIGETPSAEDAAKALEQLNFLVKTWGADAKPKLWQSTEAAVTLVASQAAYTASPVTLARKVVSIRRRTGTLTAQNDVPLNELSRQDYDNKANKLSTGTPTEYYFDPQRATRSLYVWPVPDATIAASTTLRLTYLRVIEDLDSLDDDFDIPQEWLEVLQYSLAARLAVPYDLHLTNPTKAAEIKGLAQSFYAQLSAFDDESASVFMQPA
jgi:hypothetical protein